MRKSLITFAAAAMTAATLIAAPMASAADRYFLKLDGVTGESATSSTTGLIALNSFQWGAESSSAVLSPTGAGVGKAKFDTLTVTKNVDSASPVLFQKLAQAGALPGMELVAQHVGANGVPVTYLRYQFQPVYLVSQTQSAEAGDSAVAEKLEFAYGAVKQSFVKQTSTGAMGATVFASWNQLTNSSLMAAIGAADPSATIKITG